MDIVVCIKRVPDTREAELTIAKDSRSIEEKGLVFDINDWDRYAVEEAIQLKEKLGGTVTAVTLGPDESDDTLRRCFATGVDNGIRLTDATFDCSDAAAIARILHQAVKNLKFDLLLTGAQASDDGYAQVGPALAELLGIPHATIVTSLEMSNGKATVHRELEGGLEEMVELKLPAVLTIQTGINQPRYVSIMGVRKAAKKEVSVKGLPELGLAEADVGEKGSQTRIERLFLPPATKQTEILQGNSEDIAARLAQILKDRGGLV